MLNLVIAKFIDLKQNFSIVFVFLRFNFFKHLKLLMAPSENVYIISSLRLAVDALYLVKSDSYCDFFTAESRKNNFKKTKRVLVGMGTKLGISRKCVFEKQ